MHAAIPPIIYKCLCALSYKVCNQLLGDLALPALWYSAENSLLNQFILTTTNCPYNLFFNHQYFSGVLERANLYVVCNLRTASTVSELKGHLLLGQHLDSLLRNSFKSSVTKTIHTKHITLTYKQHWFFFHQI